MRIVIAGGRSKADFLISSLLTKNHELIVINDSHEFCEYLSGAHGISVVYGDPCKQYVLEDAAIKGYDVIIALKPEDADNLAICQTAKRIYEIKKAVCIVSNPKNVDVFKKLGVNTVISATYMVANMIEQASTIESLIKTLSIEDDKIVLNEILVSEDSPVIGKTIATINFPQGVIISCIIRGNDILVPNGQTLILSADKLLIISSPQNSELIIPMISGRK